MAERPASGPGWISRLVFIVVALVGVAMALQGAWLASVGGSPYYLAAGVLVAAGGVQAWRGARSAGWIYLAALALTLIWAVYEAGFDGWALLPRLDLILGLGVLFLLALRPRRSTDAAQDRGLARGAAAAAMLCAAGLFGFVLRAEGSAAHAAAAAPQAVASAGQAADWPQIGGDLGSDRYSALQQISPANVKGLQVAWRAHLGMPPAGMAAALEATPIKIGDSLYVCNGAGAVVALDAASGAIRWRFDPHIDPAGLPLATCRGVSYVRAAPQGPCAERIVATVVDGRLIALDAASGARCADFGSNGEVSLLDGLGAEKGYYYVTSPAVLVRGRLVVGGAVTDGQKVGEPSGVIRAFDAITGKFSWAWDLGRPGDRGMPGPGQTFSRGTPNAWAPMSGDETLGLVYVPLGNATPDYVASHRSPEMDRYSSSLVALDATTGDPRWSFQTTHRDIWDYDVPSAASLVDFPTPTGDVPALVQPTKRGQFFVLDRRTGTPLVPVVEHPAPQDPAAGERLSPTQPYPVGFPALGGARLTEAKMWGLTPFDQMWCRIRFRQARYDGDFTPVTLRRTIVFPGYLGGTDWGGAAVDPQRRLLVATVSYFPMYNQLVRRKDADPSVFRPMVAGSKPYNNVHVPQGGAAYSARITPFVSPLGVPCSQPPYSEIALIDLAARTVRWRNPLGTAQDSGPKGIATRLPIPMGVPIVGGSLITQTGLIFIGATQERTFRAISVADGKILWSARLPAAGHANPMTYADRSGRQFVVIAAGGHPLMGGAASDELVAYALPKGRSVSR